MRRGLGKGGRGWSGRGWKREVEVGVEEGGERR